MAGGGILILQELLGALSTSLEAMQRLCDTEAAQNNATDTRTDADAYWVSCSRGGKAELSGL